MNCFSRFLIKLAFVVILPAFFGVSYAQLTGWQYVDAVTVHNPASEAKINWQVLVIFNSLELISLGKMKADGSDLRFAADCEGKTLLKHYIESGINTEKTHVWVAVPSLPSASATMMFMFYGNQSATTTSDFEGTFPQRLVINASPTPTIIDETTDSWTYDWIEIKSGASVLFNPLHSETFTIKARRIIIDGAINGDGLGFDGGLDTDGEGPGGGKKAPTTGGGGGAYGGNGGKGSWCCSDPTYSGDGGMAYGDTTTVTIEAGSGGGAPGLIGTGTKGGNGGIAFIFNTTSMRVNGSITGAGIVGECTNYCAGGGAGGGVLISTTSLEVGSTGVISVNGGDGGSSAGSVYYAGGGGSGGRAKIFYQKDLLNSGTISAKKGKKGVGGVEAATAGEEGTITIINDSKTEPIVVLSRGLDAAVAIKATKISTCEGASITFTAIAGNGGSAPSYQWKVNDVDVPGETLSSFTTSSLMDSNRVSCLLVSNAASCIGNIQALSNVITVAVSDPVVAEFTMGTPEDRLVINKEIKFTSAVVEAVKWFWDFGDGEAPLDKQEVTHTYVSPGEFMVTHIVYTASCSDTISKKLVINEMLGIDNRSGIPQLIAYPNPTNGKLVVKLYERGPEDLRIDILGMQGNRVYSDKLSGNQITIDLTGLPYGIYLLMASDQKGNYWTEKLIIQ